MAKQIISFNFNEPEQALYITERFPEGVGEPGTDTIRIDKKGLKFTSADGTLTYKLTLNDFLWLIVDQAVESAEE